MLKRQRGGQEDNMGNLYRPGAERVLEADTSEENCYIKLAGMASTDSTIYDNTISQLLMAEPTGDGASSYTNKAYAPSHETHD